MEQTAIKSTRTDLWGVLISQIVIEDGHNVRKDMGDLNELADSIVEHGIIQPINAYIKKGEKDIYTLLNGHRRIAATKIAIADGRLDAETFRIPLVKARAMSDIDRVLSNITFNDGKPLTIMEQAEAYNRAIKYGATEEEVAKRVGKSITTIKNALQLLTAGVYTRKMMENGSIAATNVITMLKTNEPSVVDEKLKEIYEQKKSDRVKAKQEEEPLFVHTPAEISDVSEFGAMQDNTKTTGVSGMELPEDSGAPIKIKGKDLSEKKAKAITYDKEYILALLRANGVSEDESAYIILNESLI